MNDRVIDFATGEPLTDERMDAAEEARRLLDAYQEGAPPQHQGTLEQQLRAIIADFTVIVQGLGKSPEVAAAFTRAVKHTFDQADASLRRLVDELGTPGARGRDTR